jgi:hypothetical protein
MTRIRARVSEYVMTACLYTLLQAGQLIAFTSDRKSDIEPCPQRQACKVRAKCMF